MVLKDFQILGNRNHQIDMAHKIPSHWNNQCICSNRYCHQSIYFTHQKSLLDI